MEEVKKKDYDCATFICALTIPVSIKLREQILCAYVSKEMAKDESVISAFKTKLQNVKDTWKSFMIPKLGQALEKHTDLSTPSPFLIEIFLSYDDDEIIFKELYVFLKN